MKTTIEISDSLFEKTKRFASQQENTFREVVESALSFFLKERQQSPKPFKMKKCFVNGRGLVGDLKDWDWAEIRRRTYEGRGG